MELRPYSDDDRWLLEALETDPVVMEELGGAWPADAIPGIHRRRLKAVEDGAWVLTIIPDPSVGPVGGISLWRSDSEGESFSEAGWMVLPAQQGKGYASAALRSLIERARADGRWGDIHAFPGVTNAASNALCRGAGFELLTEADVDYGGRTLRCNHWVLRA